MPHERREVLEVAPEPIHLADWPHHGDGLFHVDATGATELAARIRAHVCEPPVTCPICPVDAEGLVQVAVTRRTTVEQRSAGKSRGAAGYPPSLEGIRRQRAAGYHRQPAFRSSHIQALPIHYCYRHNRLLELDFRIRFTTVR